MIKLRNINIKEKINMFLPIVFLLSTLIYSADAATNSAQETVQEIMSILQSGADKDYIGENISQLHHALQCAQRAKDAHADQETIIAALLHDIGHSVGENTAESMQGYGTMHHEKIGAQYVLEHGFSCKVAELIKGHVDAKRYLTYADKEYYRKLSDASKETLKMQGGQMTPAEAYAFEQDPLFEQKILMRTWDEQAKEINATFAPLEMYYDMMLNTLSKNTLNE